MLQRLSIARALIHNPDVLLLDEPYTGLDQDASGILDSLLVQAHGDGKTIIMVTHELDRAQRLAQRAIIISRGAIVLDAPMSSIEYLPARYTEVTGMTTR
ncbi:MAG: hypothetical protein IPO91_25880 [Chloroflexi bacterium]|nr:hypothetical protein [Chloroflexota bacterium]